MAREFAKAFYNSGAWRKTSKAYAKSKFYLCEKCGHQGYIVHHIKHLTPQTLSDPAISLSWSNLMYLCVECHNRIHGKEEKRAMIWDEEGNLIGCTDAKPPHHVI